MRLCMDQENYPHDFVTALVPAPVPDDEQYNTEFYRTHAGTPGAGDLMCIAANTKYPEACFKFAMWYLKGGMAPLVKGGRIPLWNGIDKQAFLDVLKENAEGPLIWIHEQLSLHRQNSGCQDRTGCCIHRGKCRMERRI